ncbi:MAG: peroxidase family protein [Pirellulaceae bacterium]
MDLAAAINIQRGRDMGCSSYNQARCDMARWRSPRSTKSPSNATIASQLEMVYGDVESIDLRVGGLAEDYVPGVEQLVRFRRHY